jgi:hypothetical protein
VLTETVVEATATGESAKINADERNNSEATSAQKPRFVIPFSFKILLRAVIPYSSR